MAENNDCGTPPPVTVEMQSRIGEKLREIYEPAVAEPLPEALQRLLDALEREV